MLHSSSHDFERLLEAGASWLLIGCGVWAVVIGAAAVVEATTGGRVRATAWVGCPPLLRRTLLAGLGVALAGVPTVAGPSSAVTRASDGGSEGAGASRATGEQSLPTPARPPGRASGRASTGAARLVVRPGDTLWHLAEVRLPSSAPATRVAALVTLVHHRNRAVIGADPDLIRPGQPLVLPHVHNPVPTAPTPSRGEP